MTDDLKLVARSMKEVPPLRPEVRARMHSRLSEVIDVLAVTPRRKASRRGYRTVAAAAAAVALCASVVGFLVISRDNEEGGPSVQVPTAPNLSLTSLVRFTDEPGFVVAEITEPRAAKEQLDAVFRAHGFDISVSLLPVSPSLVGSIVHMSTPDGAPPLQTMQSGSCVTGSGGQCPIGLRIPVGYAGHADVAVGRAAVDDEKYASATSAFATGEALTCSGVHNASVAAATAVLQRLGLRAVWRAVVPVGPVTNGSQSVDVRPIENPPEDFYVTTAIPLSPTTVVLVISEKPTPDTADDETC